MQGGFPGHYFLLAPGGEPTEDALDRRIEAWLEQTSAPMSISNATTRWQSSTGSACCGATATGLRCCRSTRRWCGSTASGTISSRSTEHAPKPIRGIRLQGN